MTRPLCIYHANCDDGFAAAWVVRLALRGEVDFHPGVYLREPPPVNDRDVLLVDFSYKRPVLLEMAKHAHSITILDHHKTAAEDLIDLPRTVRVEFDMDRSGAGITWDHFNYRGSRPEFINYIEDRDLWHRKLPGADEFTIALRSYDKDFEIWDRLVSAGPKPLIADGRSIQRYYRLRVEELKQSAYLAELGGAVCFIANTPYFAASEVAGELAERDGLDFGACYFEVARGRWQYSLRSRGEFDVSAVASKFGGGGHHNAAGFTVETPVHGAL